MLEPSDEVNPVIDLVIDLTVSNIDVGGIGNNVHCSVPDLIAGKLSDGILGFSIANIFARHCNGPNPSYKRGSGIWSDWKLSRLCTEQNQQLRRTPAGENAACALETLSRIVDLHRRVRCSRTWQGHDIYKPIAHKPYHPIPDLVLVDSTNANKRVEWKDVYAVVQFGDTGKASPDINDRQRVYCKLAQAARLHLRFRPTLRFSLGVAVFGTICTFVKFDRAGMLISHPFHVHRNPEVFLRVMIGLLYVDRAYLGFDTNISEDDTVLMTNGEEWQIVERLCNSFEICEKGTVVASVKRKGEGRLFIEKNYWKPRGKSLSEVGILQEVRGIKGIIQLEYFEQVRVLGQLDTTGAARARVPQEEMPDWRQFGDLVHYRLILNPAGLAIEHFASLKELLSVVRDMVKAIEVLHSRGIVHRDIGPRNIILVDPEDEERAQQGSSRVRRGVLIDFDLAAKAETLRTTRLPSRWNGTMPFVATELLVGDNVIHEYVHDLESLFCVLCWIPTAQTGPGNKEDKARLLHPERYELGRWMVGTGNTRSVGIRKRDVCSKKGLFEREILGQFHSPYFNSMKACTEELRVVFFPEKPSKEERQKTDKNVRQRIKRGKNPLPSNLLSTVPISERPPVVVFDTLKGILTKWISSEVA